MINLDLREIDVKLGPVLKWHNRRKQLEKIQIKHDKRPQGGRYPIASKYLERISKQQKEINKQLVGFVSEYESRIRYNSNHNIRPQYVHSKDFGKVVPEDFTTVRYL